MTAVLRNLRVDFGSLVDEPANKGARIMLFKRDDDALTADEIAAALSGDVTKVGRKMSRQRMTALKAALEHLNRILSEVGDSEGDDAEDQKEQSMSKKTDTPATEPAKETPEAPAVEKAAVPEDIAKRLADLEAQNVALKKAADDAATVAKAERDARLTGEFIAKAAKLEHLPAKADVLGPILKRIAENAATDEDRAELDRILTAANEAVGKSAAFTEVGQAGGDTDSAGDRLNKMALDLVVEKKAADYATAFTIVSRENPELAAAYLAEQRSRH